MLSRRFRPIDSPGRPEQIPVRKLLFGEFVPGLSKGRVPDPGFGHHCVNGVLSLRGQAHCVSFDFLLCHSNEYPHNLPGWLAQIKRYPLASFPWLSFVLIVSGSCESVPTFLCRLPRGPSHLSTHTCSYDTDKSSFIDLFRYKMS